MRNDVCFLLVRGQKICLHNITKTGIMEVFSQGSFPHYPQTFPQVE